MNFDELIKQQIEVVADLKTTRKEATTAEQRSYLDGQLKIARDYLAELRKRSKPAEQDPLVDAVCRSLSVSLLGLRQSHGPIDPAVLQLAAERVVAIVNAARHGKSAEAGHSKPGGYREKKNKLIAEYKIPGRFATKDECAEWAVKALHMGRSTALRHLTNL